MVFSGIWSIIRYHLPQYDHEKMVEATRENPFWIHYGAGNIFRAFQANVVESLLNEGLAELVCKYFAAMLQGPGSVEKLLVTL